MLSTTTIGYVAATVIGAIVGATELIQRYRDRPMAPLSTFPGWIYILVNAGASAAALALIVGLDTGPALTFKNLSPLLPQVLIAGICSMAFFRSSFLTIRLGDVDYQAGPALILQIILAAADRECDRLRASPRSALVNQIMQDVSFDKASAALPIYCFQLMQNVTQAEQAQLGTAIASIARTSTSDALKAANLGLVLMNVVGEDVLRQAVHDLGGRICGPALADLELLRRGVALPEDVLGALIDICLRFHRRLDGQDATAFRARANKVLEQASPRAKGVVLLSLLQDQFGADTVRAALDLLPSQDRSSRPGVLPGGPVARLPGAVTDPTPPSAESDGADAGESRVSGPPAANDPAARPEEAGTPSAEPTDTVKVGE